MSVISNSKFANKSVYILLVAIILSFCLICLIPSISYKINSDNVEFVGDRNTVTIENTLPLTDVSGKSLDSKEKIIDEVSFSVKGVGNKKRNVNYEIYLINTNVDVDRQINSGFIKVYLTNGDNKPFEFYSKNSVPAYKSLRVSNSQANVKIIYSGSVKGEEIQKFKLRVWLADNYVLNDSDRSFSGTILVKKV